MTGERFRNGHRPDSTDASIRGGLKPRSSPLRKGTRMGSEEEEQSRPKSAMGIFETETDQHRCLSVMVYHSTRDGRENFAFGSPCQPLLQCVACEGARGRPAQGRPCMPQAEQCRGDRLLFRSRQPLLFESWSVGTGHRTRSQYPSNAGWNAWQIRI